MLIKNMYKKMNKKGELINELEKETDLELRDLNQYCGTEKYHNVMGMNTTDGIQYIMKNGYSWFITDLICNIRFVKGLKEQEFLSIKLVINADKSATMLITDGNDNVLHKQEYGFTNGKKEFQLFYENGVLLYSGEH
jgi:hypothetical protein